MSQIACFERLARLESDETRHISGSGIGLARVKELVEHFHGSISLRSDTGADSTFSVKLATATKPADYDMINQYGFDSFVELYHSGTIDLTGFSFRTL